MSKVNIIRAWNDEAYRLSLRAEVRALVPAKPAGVIELDDFQLDQVAGGWDGRETHSEVGMNKGAILR